MNISGQSFMKFYDAAVRRNGGIYWNHRTDLPKKRGVNFD